MSAEICPHCSRPRAWSGWRQCPCGFDFGPQIRKTPATPPSLPTPAELQQRIRDQDFTARFLLAVLLLIVFGSAVFVALRLPGNPRLIGTVERSIGPVVPAAIHVDSLDSKNPETVMSGLHWLSERKNPAGVNRSIELLKSSDDYIWLNAAHYLGICGKQEAVPYLIKALRHTAWRADKKTVKLLREITGQDFGGDFARWHRWWMANHPEFQMDWESQLGFAPRLLEPNSRHRGDSRIK